MRPTIFATVPMLAALAAAPATAQFTARVHIDIPIGRSGPVIYRPEPAPREIVIYDYDRSEFGDWDSDYYYNRWEPITVYFYAGHYYERPIRGARAIVIYRYGNRYFYPPADRGWEQRYGRDRDWGRRDGGRDYRNDRDDRNWNDRDDRSRPQAGRPPVNIPRQDPRGQGGRPQGQDQRGQQGGRPQGQDQRGGQQGGRPQGQDQRGGQQGGRPQGQDQRGEQQGGRPQGQDQRGGQQGGHVQDSQGRDNHGQGDKGQTAHRGGRSRP